MTGRREARPRGNADRAQEMSCLGADNFKSNPPPSQSQALSRPANPTGGRASRAKGNRLERAVVRLMQDHGLGAERVPLSGSAGGSYSGDVSIPLLGIDRKVECKARAAGFKQIYGWLEGADALIVKADRKPPLVIVRLSLAVEVAAAAERGKGRAP
jgi:hypothetical protein